MSTFSQMAGLTVQNFLSAATGIAIAAALARAFVGQRGEGARQLLGRPDPHHASMSCCRCSIVLALVLVGAGRAPDPGRPRVTATTLEGAEQTIALFPVASQEAIKQLGTNGGGIFNANSAHPFENPDAC